MGRIEVPTDHTQQHADIQRQLDEQARRTIPGTGQLSSYSTGIVGYRIRLIGNKYPVGTGTDVAVMDISAPVTEGRIYKVSARAGLWVDGAGDATIESTISYTVDGTAPTTASQCLRVITTLVGQFGDVRESSIDQLLVAPPDCTTLRCLYFVHGAHSGRTYGVYSPAPGSFRPWPVEMWITDMGGAPAITGADY